MKKVLFLITVFLVCFLCVAVFFVMQRNTRVELTQECKQYLKVQGVEDYKIKKIDNNLQKVSMPQEDIEVSNEEVEERINDELSVAGEFIEITDRDDVQKGDFVEISYSVYLKDKLINSCDKEIIKVGAGYYGKEFEEKLVGIKKGIETEFEIVVPYDEKQYAGETENIKVLLSKIERKEVPVLDDKYIVDNYEDIKNVDEYYELIKSQIKEEKELQARNNKLDEVKIIKKKIYCVEISEAEKASYAEKVYKEYLQMAESMGSTIEEHQKVLEIMGLNDETCDTDDLKDNYAGSYLDDEGNMVVVLDKDESGNKVYSTRCSIGLKAYTIDSDGKKRYGFVTCGHGLAKGDTIYIDGLCKTKIGKVIKRKYSGKVDASFVEVTNSNYTPSRVVYYSNSSGSTSNGKTISTSYLYVWYTGFTVYKAGSTTYLTSGTLTSYNYSATIGNVAFKDMYKAKIKVKSGDSGGIMYTKDDGEYCALGITKCSDGTYSGFIKWNNIDDSFEIYFY